MELKFKEDENLWYINNNVLSPLLKGAYFEVDSRLSLASCLDKNVIFSYCCLIKLGNSIFTLAHVCA